MFLILDSISQFCPQSSLAIQFHTHTNYLWKLFLINKFAAKPTFSDFGQKCSFIFVFLLFRILFVCHGVMYQQLSAWVLHGLHIDKHNEFFIKEVTSADDQTVNKTDEGVTSSSSDLGIPGITGRQLAEILVRLNGNVACHFCSGN